MTRNIEPRTHRDEFRPLIATVIERVGREDRNVLMTALKSATRKVWAWSLRPYHRKIWWDEVRVQLGEPRHPIKRQRLLASEVARGQKYLF